MFDGLLLFPLFIKGSLFSSSLSSILHFYALLPHFVRIQLSIIFYPPIEWIINCGRPSLFFLGLFGAIIVIFFCDRTWTLHSVLYSLVVSTNATQSMWEIYCSMNWMARNTPFYSTIDHWYWFGTAGLSPFQFVYPSPAEFIIVQLVCQSPSQSFSWMTRRYVWVCGWLFIYHLTVYLINTIPIKTIQSANYFNTISEISFARKIEERLIHWMKRGE